MARIQTRLWRSIGLLLIAGTFIFSVSCCAPEPPGESDRAQHRDVFEPPEELVQEAGVEEVLEDNEEPAREPQGVALSACKGFSRLELDLDTPVGRLNLEPQLLVVPEFDLALHALAAPIAVRLARDGKPPYLLVLPQGGRTFAGFEKAAGLAGITSALIIGDVERIDPQFQSLSGLHITGPSNPADASMVLAKLLWRQADHVIVVPEDEPESIILGAALAAQLNVPLILTMQPEYHGIFFAEKELKARKVTFVSMANEAKIEMNVDAELEMQTLSVRDAQRRLLDTIGREKVRNLIVTRIPSREVHPNPIAFLAPYLSLRRKSAILLAQNARASLVEEETRRFIGATNLYPETLTLLANEETIGLHQVLILSNDIAEAEGETLERSAVARMVIVRDRPSMFAMDANAMTYRPENDDEERWVRPDDDQNENKSPPLFQPESGIFWEIPPNQEPDDASLPAPNAWDWDRDVAPEIEIEVDADPFTIPRDGEALSFGVGRIPCLEPSTGSILLFLGFVREAVANDEERVLMIANPNTESGPLPLCETVARQTAAELRNHNIPLAAFYGVATTTPEIRAELTEAALILFQGHLTDNDLLSNPPQGCYSMQADEEDEPASPIANPFLLPQQYEDDERNDEGLPPQDFPPFDPYMMARIGTPAPFFRGMPIMFFQSCQSLDEETLNALLNHGGAALIGSTKNIHSASGSTFLHRFVDGLIADGQTIGEAMRDARNYFFCLQDLKNARGHKQQSKSFRVALSFRIWGDPELMALHSKNPPLKRRVSARWKDEARIEIRTPKRHLPKVETKGYQAYFYPGTQAAGVVKRLKNTEQRRLMQFWQFALPLQRGQPAPPASRLARDGEESVRTVYRIDPLHRRLHILHFPKQTLAGEHFELRFVEEE